MFKNLFPKYIATKVRIKCVLSDNSIDIAHIISLLEYEN